MERLFHIALREDWDAARALGIYRVSTLGTLLDEQGFIHLSFAHQVKLVADARYRGRDDLVLIELDADRVGPRVRIEDVPDSDEPFPHLYGAIAPDDVLGVRPLRPGADDGCFDAPA